MWDAPQSLFVDALRDSPLTMCSRTQTEQKQKLERQESRTIIDQVKTETASLRVDNDALSVLSLDPSVHFEMDHILMKHPAYIQAYGRVRMTYCSAPSLS